MWQSEHLKQLLNIFLIICIICNWLLPPIEIKLNSSYIKLNFQMISKLKDKSI